jgi:hypothetical protein
LIAVSSLVNALFRNSMTFLSPFIDAPSLQQAF